MRKSTAARLVAARRRRRIELRVLRCLNDQGIRGKHAFKAGDLGILTVQHRGGVWKTGWFDKLERMPP